MKAVNPFYVVLVVVGVLFTITACSYFVLALQATQNPIETQKAIESGEGFLAIMDRNGVKIMTFEIAVLALATVAAISTDGFWTRKAQTVSGQIKNDTDDNQPTSPSSN